MSDELENTERSRIRQLIQDTVQQATIGQVQEIFPHTGDEERPSNHEVTVSSPPGPNPTQTYQRRPIVTATSGVVNTPQVDDLVLLIFSARTDDPFILGNVYGDQDKNRAPIANPDSIRLSRNGASVDIITTENNETVVQVVDRASDVPSSTDELSIGLEVNIDTGDIVLKNQNGHGIEVPANGDVTIYGKNIDLNTDGSASFNQ